jgi:hypothetical protein
MTNKVYTTGDTVRITNTITGYDGQPLDPDTLTFNTYTTDGTLLTTSVVDLVANRMDAGVYYVDITLAEGTIVYEWVAVKGAHNYVKRDNIQATFLGYW